MALTRSHDIWQVFTSESFRYITVYAASMLTVLQSIIKTVQEKLFAFLWKIGKRKIKRVVMYHKVNDFIGIFL